MVVVDHVFICTARNAPAGDLLVSAGLTEGSPNRHLGQGTACRRFYFSNAMLELLWLEDETEAQGATRLWERLSAAKGTVSPFGIILRPAPGSEPVCPWRSWTYRPLTMPGLELEIASDTELQEPMWCFMKNGRPPEEFPVERRQPLEHPAGFQAITCVSLCGPGTKEGSVTSAMAQQAVIALQSGVEHVLDVQFDHCRQGSTLDFRPTLPLIFRV
jgi:hypothetical protein